VGEDAQRARELLRNGQLTADAGSGTGLAHLVHGTARPGETVPVSVVVIGGTGPLGSEIVRELARRDVAVRAVSRRIDAARPEGVDLVTADLADPDSLDRAFAGAKRVFLLSSPTRDQVRLETNGIAAAERAGADQVVKISNIPIPGVDDGLHGNHRAIERRLAASPVSSTVLQPSFFTSVLERQLALLRRGRLVMPTGEGRIAWIDPRDIAAVAAEVLAAADPPRGAYRLTGPEALSAAALTERLAQASETDITLLQPDRERWHAELVAAGMDPWLADSTHHLYDAVARDALADVSPGVQHVLRRSPRPVDDWLRERLAPLLAR
jgi:uncharacterized protein YbjT (DUF2867 family)